VGFSVPGRDRVQSLSARATRDFVKPKRIDQPTFDERVDGDVALGQEDEPGYAPFLGRAVSVPDDDRLRDAGHADAARVLRQQVLEECLVLQQLLVVAVSVH